MAVTLAIQIEEKTDASGFKLYDLSNWGGLFDHAKVTAITMDLEYGGDTYIYYPVYGGASDMKTEMGIGAGYVNLCGNSINSYFTVTPDHFYNGTVQLNSTYLPDGYYEITLYVTYTLEGDLEAYSHQGFLAENYLMAAKLPLTIDINNFDYEENRLQFLCIAMLRAATWAAELGRQTEFEEITTKVNDFLDARNINEIWST